MTGFKAYGYILFLPLIITLSCLFVVQSTNAKEIQVGGKGVGWLYGVNYAKWASEASPIHVNDVLVFDFTTEPETIPHNVYLLKSKISYRDCTIAGARFLANSTTTKGKPFRFKLRKAQRYYFACGVGNGTHCNLGLMKFGVVVQP